MKPVRGRRAWLAAIALAALGVLTAHPAAAAGAVQRPPDTYSNRLALADTLGGLHYLTIICSGRMLQDWRNRMSEMLQLEPLSDYERDDLIAAFNHGYRTQKRYFPQCTAQNVDQISAQKRYLAKEGKILAAALADPYLH